MTREVLMKGRRLMSSEIVTYELDDSTLVEFEIDPRRDSVRPVPIRSQVVYMTLWALP